MVSIQNIKSYFESIGSKKFEVSFVKIGCSVLLEKKFCPSVDLDSKIVDDLSQGFLQKVLKPEFLLNGRQHAANNFARAFHRYAYDENFLSFIYICVICFSAGKELIESVSDSLRKMAENCDKVLSWIWSWFFVENFW